MRIQLRDLPRPKLRLSAGKLPHGPSDARRILGIEQAGQRLILGGVMSLWLGAGLADWYIHRRTGIQDTAGPRESMIHSLMFAETGVPILLALFCEVNAGAASCRTPPGTPPVTALLPGRLTSATSGPTPTRLAARVQAPAAGPERSIWRVQQDYMHKPTAVHIGGFARAAITEYSSQSVMTIIAGLCSAGAERPETCALSCQPLLSNVMVFSWRGKPLRLSGDCGLGVRP